MTTAGTIPFLKMNGLGNDFVVIDLCAHPLAIDAGAARRLADREAGIGCDQVILLEPSGVGDVFMRIRNADGAEVDACGNAARCVAWLVARDTANQAPRVETNAGLLATRVAEDGMVTVDMGAPRLAWNEIPLAEPFHDTRRIELEVGPLGAPVLHSPSVVNVGNPHCIFWVDDIAAHDLAAIGPVLEHHPYFPERANISLAEVTSRQAIRLKVWERGAGLTRACGTAACAAAVAGARLRLTDRRVCVTLPGGALDIAWHESDDHIAMTGPSALEFEGILEPSRYGIKAA